MMATVLAMPGQAAPARRLADALGAPCAEIEVHRFPDGESRVRVPAIGETALVYCSLDDPNAKLVELMLAASALADRGAKRRVLVAPYLCYMRQDTAFAPGEAVSQRVIGDFLAARFERIVTVDPHLHRTPDIGQVFPGAEADALTATGVLADMIAADPGTGNLLLVGPDAESEAWVSRVAGVLDAPFLVGRKVRRGDRDVAIEIAGIERAEGRQVVIVDDLVSSGATLAECARLALEAGAATVEAAATHCLSSRADHDALVAAGLARLRSTDAIAHFTNAAGIAPVVAAALQEEIRR
ncbi:phosphoribosylpyrophosphate synthetase [Marinicauda salina]|uniref:Phosphoribosylpyrophosphate synthetase n=1 Tax=Marinicauda salina TaxID=2135793 RepID=A0A2U2BWU6_9PROT|nr:ribose-phosphate diphosphokinase [Marinicauda salina]PWE18493.1 phosphoribosylpyrophosphate synthetase [Marinicauda salina]